MPQWIEWVGYIGSFIVLVSLLMGSIKKLRWINLVGAIVFAFYGVMIASIPTAFMNIGIVIIDAYYLIKIYQSKDYFRVQPIEKGNGYLKEFLNFYNDDINSFVSVNEDEILDAKIKFYVLRNMTPACIFIADEMDSKTLEIKLDYAIPQYRDLKIGKFVYDSQTEEFRKMGYTQLMIQTDNKAHADYIKRMGFKENEEGIYIKEI